MVETMIKEKSNEEMCTCHHCQTEIAWEHTHDDKGNIWYCEECSVDFCTACFKKETGEEYPPGHERYEKVLCPSCFSPENITEN